MTDTNNANVADEIRNEIVITVNGRDIVIPAESLGVNVDSSERDILNAVRPIIQDREGLDIQDDTGVYGYTVRKAMNSRTAYIYPKPVAGWFVDSVDNLINIRR